MKQFKRKHIAVISKQAGATLVVIIIAMLFIAVLGAAVYTLTSVATLNQIHAQRAARAFYLSESGVRIAAGEYKAAANKNATLITLHDKIFPIPDSTSNNNVKIKVYPYWFYADTSFDAGVSTLTLNLPGELPLIDDTGDAQVTFPAGGLLRIKNLNRPGGATWSGTNFVYYSAISVGAFNPAIGRPVTFTLDTAKPPLFQSQIIAGDEFYLGSDTLTTAQAANQSGEDLIINLASTNDDYMAQIFPPRQGTIFVVMPASISQYSYTSRIITTTATPHTVKLTNIQPVAGAAAPQWPLNVDGRQIYVGKNLGFRALSTFGQ